MRRPLTLAGSILMLATLPLRAAADRHELYVAPGAVDIDRKALQIKHSVSYYLPEAYPAKSTLEFIKRSLADEGWRPTTRVDVPNQWSSHDSGWLEVPSSDGCSAARMWSATWVNARGDQAHYSLHYRSSAPGGLQPTHVHVGAWYEDRRAAERSRIESDKRMPKLQSQYASPKATIPCPR
jgi:hypothetical protein